MSSPKTDHLVQLLPKSDLALDITAFLIDRQARGLSPRTVEYYTDELANLRAFLDTQGVTTLWDATPPPAVPATPRQDPQPWRRVRGVWRNADLLSLVES